MKLLQKNSDLIKILANTAWMVFDKVFMLVLNLFVLVKIANYYGALGYGSYQYAVNIVAVFEIVATFVDARVVKKKYGDIPADRLVMTATAGRVLLSGAASLAGVIFTLFYHPDLEFSIMFVVLLLNLVVSSAKFGMTNRFEYLLKSKKIVIASDAAAFASALLQLLAVYRCWPVRALTYITLAATAMSTVILYIQYQREFAGRTACLPDWKLLKEMIVESVPLAIAASCAVLYARCDSIMLGAMLTKAEVGIYSISVSLINVVQIVIVPVRESVYPQLIRLYREDKKLYAKRYVQISSILTWIYIGGVALSFVVLPYAFRFLNPEYGQAFFVYRVHVLGTFFMYNAALRAGHFTLIGKGSVLTISQMISVVANIVMNFVGIQLWGIYGAAIATVITQGVSLFFSNLYFGEEGREVFRWQMQALNPFCILKK